MGHSLVRSLIRSHRSLIGWLCLARLAHQYARSLHLELVGKANDSMSQNTLVFSRSASSSSSSILAAFVAANEVNLGWKARELDGISLPEQLQRQVIQLLCGDLSAMGRWDELCVCV